MKTLYILASDPRFDLLAQKGVQHGFEVLRIITTPPREPSLFFFPFGEKNEKVLDTLADAPPKSIALVGKADGTLRAAAKEKKITVKGILEQEKYLLQNSAATAEGVLANIIEKTDRRLSELCILIYGYGNCGKEIAKLLWLCGCEVWVWSREKGQKCAQQDGFNIYDAPTLGLGMFDAVINTVPDPIFSEQFIATMREGSHFFQVATGTSGICAEDAWARGLCYHDLHGLPGKYAPASEADALWDQIREALAEQNRKE